MLEKDIEKKMCDAFRRRGAWAVKLEGTVSGLPDRLVVLPGGGVVWVELKQENGRLSAVQKHAIARLQRMGHHTRVVYGLCQALALVDEVMGNEVHSE